MKIFYAKHTDRFIFRFKILHLKSKITFKI